MNKDGLEITISRSFSGGTLRHVANEKPLSRHLLEASAEMTGLSIILLLSEENACSEEVLGTSHASVACFGVFSAADEDLIFWSQGTMYGRKKSHKMKVSVAKPT